jgi:hypothetical protein
MGDFLSKFENFIFDILGLVLPGLILSVLLLFPIYLFDFDTIMCNKIKSSVFITAIYYGSEFFKNEIDFSNVNHAVLFGLACYILGHLVKVMSIITYELLVVIFDKGLNKLVKRIYTLFSLIIDRIWTKLLGRTFFHSTLYNELKGLLTFFKRLLEKIFTFQGQPYESSNKPLLINSVSIINTKLGMSFPVEWYSAYKLSVIIGNQENLKSLTNHYLSKYNLYRSLSFINIVVFLYCLTFFTKLDKYLDPGILGAKNYILALIALLWFTFNYKFKRYWMLCGNEALVSMFYFLNKAQLK